MEDFIIDNILFESKGGLISNSSGKKGIVYDSLKEEYRKLLKKSEKSELRSSVTFKQTQLEHLKKLLEAAKKEGVSSDIPAIEEEIEQLTTAINAAQQEGKSDVSYDYYSKLIAPKNRDWITLLNACKNSKGEIDDSTRKLVSLFKYTDVSPSCFSKFVDKCRNIEERIPPETYDAISKMIDAEVPPEFIMNLVEDMPVSDESSIGNLDFSWVPDFIGYRNVGLSDSDSAKLAQNIPNNYTNKEDVYSAALSLSRVGFGVDTSSRLISLFSVSDTENDTTTLVKDSVKSVVAMKKNMALTRINEKKDRQSPINKLNVYTYSNGNLMITFKDDEIIHVCDIKDGETVCSAQKEYDEVVSQLEKDIVYDFAKKYTDRDGKIDLNALRTFNTLRVGGVSYEQLLPLTEECLVRNPEQGSYPSKYSIDIDKLKTLCTLKKAGALSTDLKTILDSIKLDDDSKYSAVDIENACDLTRSVIAGKEVASLLPLVRNSEELKATALDYSSMLEKKEFILPLLKLSMDSFSNYDSAAVEIIYSLASNLLYSENSDIKDENFVAIATKVIDKSLSSSRDNVDENCMSVCIALCRKKESVANILKALELTRDEFGYPNEALSDIVWDMCRQNACFTDIVDLLNICKPINGIVDPERAELIADLLDKNCSVDEVMEFASQLGKK